LAEEIALKDFVADLHVSEVEVGKHVGEQRQKAVAE
jgi:hypothetical protein